MIRVLAGLLFCVFSFTSFSQSSDRPVQPDLPGEIMVDFAYNFLQQFPNTMDTDFFPSRSFGLYYQRTFKLSDRFTFNPGIGVTNDRLGWSNSLNFIQDSTRTFSFDTLDGIFPRKNMLIFSYLEIPVEFRYYPVRKTIDGDGFFISVGGMIGLRVNSHTKIKYRLNGNTTVEKERSGFGLNDFRYGYMVRAGWKPINLFFKQYVSDLFQNPPFDVSPTMFTIGLNFSGF